MSILKDFSLLEISLKTAVNIFYEMSCWQRGCQLVLLEKVIRRPGSMALQHAGPLMDVIASDVHCLPRGSLWSPHLSVLSEWLSDAIHVAYVTHLRIVISESGRKRRKRVPGENAERHPWGFSHIWRCLPSKSFAGAASVPPISCSPWRIGVSTYQRQNAYSTQSVRAATIY